MCGSTRLHATVCGHIYNVKMAKNRDNGEIICRGDFVDGEYYNEDTTSEVNTVVKVIGKAANGNYYVEVQSTRFGELLVLQVPESYYEFSSDARDEKYFYNKKGDIARCYALEANDVFELSTEGFSTEPTVGSTYIVGSNSKFAPSGGGGGAGTAVVGTGVVGTDVAG